MMKAETKVAVLAVMAMVATKCACCGQKLTDPLSQEAGMGPKCRKDAGYDAPDGETSWAHAFAALGADCPDEVYAVAFAVRMTHGDAEGVLGARKLAQALVKRIALARIGLLPDNLHARIDYVRALSALGFRKLAARIAHTGLGLDVASVIGEGEAARVVISRRTFQRKEFEYPSVEAAVAACLGSLYPVVIVGAGVDRAPETGKLVVSGGRVVGPEPVPGDWFVDPETGEGIRPAFPGEERPGMVKVDGWKYFSREEVEKRFLARGGIAQPLASAAE